MQKSPRIDPDRLSPLVKVYARLLLTSSASCRPESPLSFLKMLPFIFHPLLELLDERLAVKLGEKAVVLAEIRRVDEPPAQQHSRGSPGRSRRHPALHRLWPAIPSGPPFIGCCSIISSVSWPSMRAASRRSTGSSDPSLRRSSSVI